MAAQPTPEEARLPLQRCCAEEQPEQATAGPGSPRGASAVPALALGFCTWAALHAVDGLGLRLLSAPGSASLWALLCCILLWTRGRGPGPGAAAGPAPEGALQGPGRGLSHGAREHEDYASADDVERFVSDTQEHLEASKPPECPAKDGWTKVDRPSVELFIKKVGIMPVVLFCALENRLDTEGCIDVIMRSPPETLPGGVSSEGMPWLGTHVPHKLTTIRAAISFLRVSLYPTSLTGGRVKLQCEMLDSFGFMWIDKLFWGSCASMVVPLISGVMAKYAGSEIDRHFNSPCEESKEDRALFFRMSHRIVEFLGHTGRGKSC